MGADTVIGQQPFKPISPIVDSIVPQERVNYFDSTLEEILNDKIIGKWNIDDRCMEAIEKHTHAFIQASKRLPVGFQRQFYVDHIIQVDEISGDLGIAVTLKSHTPDFIAHKVKEAFGPNIGVFVEQSDC